MVFGIGDFRIYVTFTLWIVLPECHFDGHAISAIAGILIVSQVYHNNVWRHCWLSQFSNHNLVSTIVSQFWDNCQLNAGHSSTKYQWWTITNKSPADTSDTHLMTINIRIIHSSISFTRDCTQRQSIILTDENRKVVKNQYKQW